MVDIISNRFQGVYDSWNHYNNNDNNGGGLFKRPAAVGANGTTATFHARQMRKEQDAADHHSQIQARERSLYQLKETTPVDISASVPTVTAAATGLGLSCKYCTPDAAINNKVHLSVQDRRRNVTDVLRTRPQLLDNGQGRTSMLSPSYWFPNVMQCLYNHRYDFPDVSDKVLVDDRVKNAIDKAVVESVRERRELLNRGQFDEEKVYAEMLSRNKKRAQTVLNEMKAKLSNKVLNFLSWLVYTCLPMFLSGAIMHPGHLEMIKAAMKKSPNTPLIFLPLHRSHLDYILVTFMSFNNNIQCPVVVAGDNLRIPVVGALLRGVGAFFIKRKIDPVVGKKDVVYRSVLHSYLQHCLTANHNLEFFMEGGRTRTGKPCMPKGGVLSVIIDAFVEGSIKDALLVPVSVNYEKLVDGNFVNEQLGQRKKKETLLSALRVFWKSINSYYGLMRIDFNEPFSLKQLVTSCHRIQEQQQQRQFQMPRTVASSADKMLHQTKSSTSLFGTDIVEEELRTIVDNVARHVVYDSSAVTTVMSSNAVVFLLMTRYRAGASLATLSVALDYLRTDLEGVKDVGFSGPSTDVINYVVDMMGENLIGREQLSNGEVFIKPVQTIESLLELAYYANTLMPHYALDSVLATAICTLLSGHSLASIEAGGMQVDREELMALALEYCDILRYEFILHKPCQDLTIMLYEKLERFIEKDFVSMPKIPQTETQQMAQRLANQLSDDGLCMDNRNDHHDDLDDELGNADDLRMLDSEPITINRDAVNELLVYIGCLEPIMTTYLTVVECLSGLLGSNCIVESEFFKICIKQLKENYRSGMNKYGESVSLDMVKNGVKLLEKWAVTRVESDAGVRLLVLTDSYRSSDAIEMIYDRMQKFVPNFEQLQQQH